MKRTWFNGKISQDDMALSTDDRGFSLGDGVFETIAVTRGIALWRFEHIQRMQRAAEVLGIAFPEEQIENAIDALTYRCKNSHVLRLVLTRGAGGGGLAGKIAKPTVVGTVRPFDDSLRFEKISLFTSSIRRNLHSPSSRIKSLSYIDNVLAAREAMAEGADEALMLNSAGRVACGSIGNVFLDIEGELITPSLSEGILPGIMRNAVIKIAQQQGIAVRERQVRSVDIAKAEGMFLTNSLRFVRSVTTCDGKRFAARSKILDKIIRALLKDEQEQIILN